MKKNVRIPFRLFCSASVPKILILLLLQLLGLPCGSLFHICFIPFVVHLLQQPTLPTPDPQSPRVSTVGHVTNYLKSVSLSKLSSFLHHEVISHGIFFI